MRLTTDCGTALEFLKRQRSVLMLRHHLGGRTLEYCMAGHHLPEHHAQRVEIRADVHANAGELLRTSELRSTSKCSRQLKSRRQQARRVWASPAQGQ